jgi:hypothetical protein
VRVVLFTLLALVAFAANSLLCRAALREPGIDPATFTTIRLLAGAGALTRAGGSDHSHGPRGQLGLATSSTE